MFRVDPKTVTKWAKGGKLGYIRTLGGHRRYSEDEVRSFLGDWADKLLDNNECQRLLLIHEVTSLFRVDPKTVKRWIAASRIRSVLTPGGHHRFLESEVHALMKEAGY